MELKQLLRKTQELMRSITGLLGAEIAAPHFTTLSCRGIGLDLPPKAVPKSVVPVHWSWIALDQKYSVKGEWLEQKLKLKRKRNSWRKLYFGHDLVSGHIVCANLPTNDIGNSTALPGLLDQIGGPVKLFHATVLSMASATCSGLTERFHSSIKATITTLKKAVLNLDAALNPSVWGTAIMPT